MKKYIIIISVMFAFLIGQDNINKTQPNAISYPQSQQILIEQIIHITDRDSLSSVDSTFVEGEWVYEYIYDAWVDTTITQTLTTTVQWYDVDGNIIPWATKVFDYKIYTQAQINGMKGLLDNNHQRMLNAVQ